MRATAASSSAAGTTRLTRPQASAVGASISSPVSSISITRLRATLRPTPTAGVEQNTPTLTPGSAKRRVVRGHREVAHRHELAAGGRRDAVDARDHRLRQPRQLLHHPAAGVEELALPVGVRMRAHLLQVVAGAEARAVAGEDDDARRRCRRRARSSSASSAAIIARDSALKRSPRFSVSVHDAVARVGAARRVRSPASSGAFIGVSASGHFDVVSRSLDRARRSRLVAQHELLDLAGRGLRQLAEHDLLRRLEAARCCGSAR